MNEKEFIEALKKIKIDISEDQLRQLSDYYDMLFTKNKVMNLTSIIDKEDVYLKHFYDSLTINLIYDLSNASSLCDVGSGAGFPGIVLKIMYPELEVVLIDSQNKKISFLNEVISKLGLKKIKAICERAEVYAKKHSEDFDIVTSRAVANQSILNELCLPLVKNNGYFISMKANVDEELEDAQRSFEILGGYVEDINKIKLPIEESNRTIIKIKKIKSADKKYPRDFKEIKKKPL